jgi:hypothetical protein
MCKLLLGGCVKEGECWGKLGGNVLVHSSIALVCSCFYWTPRISLPFMYNQDEPEVTKLFGGFCCSPMAILVQFCYVLDPLYLLDFGVGRKAFSLGLECCISPSQNTISPGLLMFLCPLREISHVLYLLFAWSCKWII